MKKVFVTFFISVLILITIGCSNQKEITSPSNSTLLKESSLEQTNKTTASQEINSQNKNTEKNPQTTSKIENPQTTSKIKNVNKDIPTTTKESVDINKKQQETQIKDNKDISNKISSDEITTKLEYAKSANGDMANNSSAQKRLERITKLEEEYKAGNKTPEEVIKELDIIKNLK